MTDIEKDIKYLSLKLSATERVQELLIHLLILKETISASEAQKLLDEEYKRIPEDISDSSYKDIIFSMRDSLCSQIVHVEHYRLLSNLKKAALELHAYELTLGGVYKTKVEIEEDY
ncbi:hypothetical protein M8C85_002860 [Salmonella enterica]|uniref:Uncharacterized protein n=2 Tax=Salmonella enterica TaxID=28901 RepID=A0A760RZB0_SALER|nr:hypothetical protein [Salmonella enterica subsp. enterica serovar Glostrup]EBS4873424.1 hypothetical protein [Salmonella enterica subsp. enterica serovar Hvittingfoss]EBV6969515.1 hypothetical protein [Salmonella enterica subsp. enterica serovar Gaminara]EBX3196823.1 hypothetical protein [Salmonella enterica subsp. enterica serovar Abony]EBY7514929.1 hypothetical protein [Salmonella enterica subsp. enterica serovar Richmond]ECC3818341.1 hypothetical protein [Salmonella enterica subsp. enter